MAVLDICVLVLTAYPPRNADLSISWSFPYQFGVSIFMTLRVTSDPHLKVTIIFNVK